MACTDACRRPTPSQAHCVVCHRTFGGVRGFDRHRKNGACLEPYTLRMVDRDGIWRYPMDMDVPERLRPASVERPKVEVGTSGNPRAPEGAVDGRTGLGGAQR